MRARGWGWLKEHGGLVIVVGCILVFFRNAILYGQVFAESDTRLFYYPALAAWTESLSRGALLLWSPNVFAGFPMFADGETGMLYPINLILLRTLPLDIAFVWITVTHFLLTGVFTYAYVRLLVGCRLGATIAALSFTLGGFMVGQIQHVNLNSGAAWLPATFYLVERSLLATGRARYAWLLAAGLAFAMQTLTVHPQVPMLTGFGLAFYIPFRSLWGQKDGQESSPAIRRLVSGILMGSVVAAIGLGLGAVQLLPLLELGTYSLREGGAPYSFAKEYAQPSTNLVTLLLPYFFRFSNGFDWGLWPNWEMAIYVGVMPLALASLGAFLGKGVHRWFFLFLAVLSLWISFADYAPINLHWLLYQLPGFNFLRAPGRFALLFTFSVAMLAAIGARAAGDLMIADPGRKNWSLHFDIRNSETRLRALSFAWCTLAILLLAALFAFRLYLAQNPGPALAFIANNYLPVMRKMDVVVTPDDIYRYLLYSTDVTRNVRTASSVAFLMASAVAVLFVWLGLSSVRRRAASRWSCLWRVGYYATLLIAVADLLLFASKYHGEVAIDELKPHSGAVRFLQAQEGDYRVLGQYDRTTEPNRLLYAGVPELGGYSSLQERRHREYVELVDAWDERALDVANVRYVVTRRDYLAPGRHWHEFTIFNPSRPIVAAGSGRSRVAFKLPVQNAVIGEIRIVSHLRNAGQVPEGTIVGYVRLLPDGSLPAGARESDASFVGLNREVRLPIRAGIDTGERRLARDVSVRDARQNSVDVAFRRGDGASSESYFYGLLPVEQPVRASRVEIELIEGGPPLHVFGLAAVDATDGRVFQLERYAKDKYQVAYEDSETTIYENMGYLPRAYLVPAATLLPPGQVLASLNASSFSPRERIILEDRVDEADEVAPPEPIGDGEAARIVSYANERVELDVVAKRGRYLFLADAFYPGWHAYVDGVPTRVYRANYLFRAIAVPPGEHRVEFKFEPATFRSGAMVSAATLAVIVLCFLGIIGFRPARGHYRARALQQDEEKGSYDGEPVGGGHASCR